VKITHLSCEREHVKITKTWINLAGRIVGLSLVLKSRGSAAVMCKIDHLYNEKLGKIHVNHN
jgi:hypothetical protein